MLEVSTAVAAGLEAEALELAGDIGRHGVELRARRGAPEHRIVGDNPDAALHVRGRNGSRTTCGRYEPLRGDRSGEQREQQGQTVSHH